MIDSEQLTIRGADGAHLLAAIIPHDRAQAVTDKRSFHKEANGPVLAKMRVP
jgi:hypothetical protein